MKPIIIEKQPYDQLIKTCKKDGIKYKFYIKTMFFEGDYYPIEEKGESTLFQLFVRDNEAFAHQFVSYELFNHHQKYVFDFAIRSLIQWKKNNASH